MSSESSLASIVSIPQFAEKWDKLDDHEPLAQLHARFWGTSMQEEEEEWRIKERLAPTPHDNKQEPNKKPCNGTNEREGNNDDIIPGCYVLDIKNDAIRIESIWVRVSAFLLSKMSGVFMNIIGRVYPDLQLSCQIL